MIVRCYIHPSRSYTHSARPIGFPNTSAICGRCDRPGMILLNEQEWDDYKMGQTVFSLNNNIVQIQAENYRTPLFTPSKQAATNPRARRPAVGHLTDKRP
jgi:hypothetical protein